MVLGALGHGAQYIVERNHRIQFQSSQPEVVALLTRWVQSSGAGRMHRQNRAVQRTWYRDALRSLHGSPRRLVALYSSTACLSSVSAKSAKPYTRYDMFRREDGYGVGKAVCSTSTRGWTDRVHKEAGMFTYTFRHRPPFPASHYRTNTSVAGTRRDSKDHGSTFADLRSLTLAKSKTWRGVQP